MRAVERKMLFVITLMLIALGLFFIFDVSAPSSLVRLRAQDPYYVLKHQTVAFIIGLAVMWGISQMEARWFHALAPLFYLVALIVLALPLIMGEDSHGATRWIRVFGFSVQTSEVAKTCLIIAYAWVVKKWPHHWGFIGFIALPTLLMLAQRDFGTLVVMIAPIYVMYFLVTTDWRSFWTTTAVAFFVLLLMMLKDDYRRQRVLAFLPAQTRAAWLGTSEETEDSVDTYHVDQLQYTIGSGRLFGVGMGQSRQKRTLPEIHTDSIFAIYAEETGFFGVTFALALYVAYLIVIARIARTPGLPLPSRLIAYGIFVSMATQTLVNLAAISGAAPLTGITLPFFSYGGSSLIMSMVNTGVILSLANIPPEAPAIQIRRRKYV